MRILHSIRSVNPHGGGPIEGVKQFAAVNARAGHTVDVVSLDAPDAPWVHSFPLKCHALGPGRGSYGYSAAFVPWLREHAHEYDAVIVDGLWQYHAFGVWRVLGNRKQGDGRPQIPYFVFTHGMLDPWFKRTYPLKHLKKWLYWPWGDYRVLRDANAVLFTCEEERRLARKSFWLYRATEQVVNFGTGVPPDSRNGAEVKAFLEKFPETRDRRCVLFLGRVHEKKGTDLLLRAFAKELKEAKDARWHLVIAGPDEHEYALVMKNLVKELELENHVTWTGMLTGDLKWGAFRQAEVFILPSHQENFGIAVAEALGCGTPVLISDKVNIWREIAADGAGFVEKDDLAGTCRLLSRWAAMTEPERSVMRDKAQSCFARRFDVEQGARSLLRILESGGRPLLDHPVAVS